ncbi:hypothetical protein D3P09_08975 [Paenibacillus pinisoli]|uniref:Gfo/Idh/MocA family oxidoreductase n=1 Tax=Paenibacillus pinisoli TaxID=1276110 RepID=A0A3A6PVJ9_9BACL|nr:hypothetical protein [Paenibacillus pinisoli]RJX39543.1 hypothetical protein D3P09_08975 [Paenibacillus pinisoli]
MKKIGFIDYYLDEFHANKYPKWIEEASGGTMRVAYAYGKIDSPAGISNAEWCRSHGVELLDTIEDVVERSDYLIVLSPDNPEFHEELSDLPLRSGKPTYIDKTFAPDRAAAERMFQLAGQYGTPMYSTSALRYAAEYTADSQLEAETISSWGPGLFDTYAIHQIEPIVALMGAGASRVMYTGTAASPALLIDFGNGRQASLNQLGWECPFMMAVKYIEGPTVVKKVESPFFELFIESMVSFFRTSIPAVASSETLSVITIIEYGIKAMEKPHQWVQLPSIDGSRH